MSPAYGHPFTFTRRSRRMQASVLAQLMRMAELPGVISLSGGFPCEAAFPVESIASACADVLRTAPSAALQYSNTEGLLSLRELLSERLARRGLDASPDRILITNGSQQGLDLLGKVLFDSGSTYAVESPTYLGALQAFGPYGASPHVVESDASGPTVQGLSECRGARALYLVPTFQNPTGHSIPAERRLALSDAARSMGLPIIEDDPYGELWYDQPPPTPISGAWPEGSVYLGTFSKILAPGLRLGYVVSPAPLHALLVRAKQAADLHSATFAQHVAAKLLHRGVVDPLIEGVRPRYKLGRDAMADALERHLHGQGVWRLPGGGMFFWVRLTRPIDTAQLLPLAAANGVSFVPGAAFHADGSGHNTLRLSFVTEPPDRIERGVAILARLIKSAEPADQQPQAQ